MIFLAWGLWVLFSGQFPVRKGIAKGRQARLVGVALCLLGGIEMLLPAGFGLPFFILGILCLGAFYFMLDGEPLKPKK